MPQPLKLQNNVQYSILSYYEAKDNTAFQFLIPAEFCSLR